MALKPYLGPNIQVLVPNKIKQLDSARSVTLKIKRPI